jgi:hypothetical protein
MTCAEIIAAAVAAAETRQEYPTRHLLAASLGRVKEFGHDVITKLSALSRQLSALTADS